MSTTKCDQCGEFYDVCCQYESFHHLHLCKVEKELTQAKKDLELEKAEHRDTSEALHYFKKKYFEMKKVAENE